MPEPTEEPSDEDQTPTPIAKAGIEALTICGCGETGQVFGQQNFLSCLGIDKNCACFINTGARPAFYTVQFVKRKYQIVGREEFEPKMCEAAYALGHLDLHTLACESGY